MSDESTVGSVPFGRSGRPLPYVVLILVGAAALAVRWLFVRRAER